MLITFVIPAYNASRSIQNTLDSIFMSALGDWSVEAVVVDDGSEDSSELCKIVEKFANARMIIHETNMGMCAGRNTGIGNSKGDFVAILDADDELVDYWIEVFENIVEKWPEEVNVCYAACRNDKGKITAEEPDYEGYLTLDDLLNERYSGEYLPIFRGIYVRSKPYVDLGTKKSCGIISYINFAIDGPFWLTNSVLRIYHDSNLGSVTSDWTSKQKAIEAVQCYLTLFARYEKLYKQRAPKVYKTKRLRLAVYQKFAGTSGAWSSWARGIGFTTTFQSVATMFILIIGRSIGSKAVLFSKKIGLIRQYG